MIRTLYEDVLGNTSSWNVVHITDFYTVSGMFLAPHDRWLQTYLILKMSWKNVYKETPSPWLHSAGHDGCGTELMDIRDKHVAYNDLVNEWSFVPQFSSQSVYPWRKIHGRRLDIILSALEILKIHYSTGLLT